MLINGLGAALALAAASALAQPVEVNSLPGDPPGEKVAFQFSVAHIVGAGATTNVEIPIPEGAALTVETVTARGFTNLSVVPEVSLLTWLGESEAKHVVALARKGTALGVGSQNVYEGTHSVRLRHRADSVRPRLELRNMALTGATGNVTFRVSVAGYVTTGTRSTEPQP
jgi:hypothetical protein